MRAKIPFSISLLLCSFVMLAACQTANGLQENRSAASLTQNASALTGNQPPPLESRVIFISSGEKRWQVVYQTGWLDLANIACVENQTCFALSDGDAVLRTTDGGKSWDKLGASAMVVHSDSPFGCADGTFCLVIQSKNGGNAWVTHNGGKTWEQTGVSPISNPESIACPVLENCILVGRQGEIYSTRDGGITWKSELASNGIAYRKITCPSETVCYIAGLVFAGDYGLVVKTTDGGLTWEEAGDSPVDGLRDISCPSLNECISVGRYGIQITKDGGQSWQELSGGEDGAQSISCISLQECLIINNQGQILSWDGSRLARQPVEDEFSLRGVSCTTGGGCYVVGAFTLPNFVDTLKTSLWLAILAGLVSFLSPWVWPTVPCSITSLATHASGQETQRVSRWLILFHGIAFGTGFSIVFVVLGIAASALGQSLYVYKDWITRIGGVIIVFFGLQMAGWLQIPFLGFEIRKHAEPNPRLGYISSLFLGAFFAAGWTPGVGSALGIVLTLAGIGASLTRSILLLALYSLGLGLPIILTALARDRVEPEISRLTKPIWYIMLATGLLLAGVGILIILG